MLWPSLLGALLGSVIGFLALAGVIVVSDYLNKKKPQNIQAILDNISEKQMEQYIVKNFDTLFPDWQIYDDPSASVASSNEDHVPIGVQYATKKAGVIDILCLNSQQNLVVVELKKGKAPKNVIDQVNGYVSSVKQRPAKPDQQVKGLVIAESFDGQLRRGLNRRGIRTWTYDWQLKFNKRHSD
jgi:hypothetical protein